MNPTLAIEVEKLQKTFRVPNRTEGFSGAIKHLISPIFKESHAVRELSFTIRAGERVAFLGPNGAGKSTTIKMLSGILFPTSGNLQVLGKTPWKDRRELAFQIGTIFGQRSQLWYHLPAGETFDLLAKIYDQDIKKFRERRSELVKLFDLQRILEKPVRQLSLGERMRCEIVASLLHRPSVLFLDEPTIGLDVTAKSLIRDLVKERSEKEGTTLLLTSHDTGDIERVCDRVLIIHDGKLILDETIQALRTRFIKRKVLTLATAEEFISISLPGVRTTEKNPHRCVLEVDLNQTPVEKVVEAAMKASSLKDITIEDPPMEEIIQEVYSSAEKQRELR